MKTGDSLRRKAMMKISARETESTAVLRGIFAVAALNEL
jgi:hypothetical protein